MSTNNRVRRAAKRRSKQRNRSNGPGPRNTGDHYSTRDVGPGPPPIEEIEQALVSAAYLAAAGDAMGAEQWFALLLHLDESYPGSVDRAVESLLDRLIRAAWEGGWQPADLTEFAQRKLDPDARPLLVVAIGAEHRRYGAGTIAPHWLDQLARLGVTGRAEDERSVRHWRADRRAVGLRLVAVVAGFLLSLPKLPRIEPLPGTFVAPPKPGRRDQAGDRMLGRIRGLLAKAEATEFPDEAEALSAKAQALMAKFSLDQALVEAAPGDQQPDGTIARRMWLEQPYVSAKANLVDEVAAANRCRAISYDKLGFVAIVGAETDLQHTELLTTSLLVQANRAMVAAGAQQSRTRSYRQSFLVAYAVRIGERLRAATEAAAAAVAEPDRLLPVLAARDRQVEERFNELFPNAVARHTRVSNGAGWAAGRTAADLARLDVRSALEPD